MKIAVLSSASAGGAGIAAYRIFEALSIHQNHSVDFFDMSILGHASIEVSPHASATNREITNTHFTTDYASNSRAWLIDMLAEYDCLNIQWSSYLLSIAEILELAKLGVNILFTLHDFYFITGGCHYPAGCTGYRENCVGCSQVNEQMYTYQDVIHALKIKREIFSYPNIHLSAPSEYIVNSAVKSGIIPKERGHVLRNAYQPIKTTPVPADPGVFSLLLIADSFLEERKGIELAINAIIEFCKINQTSSDNFNLHVVGTCEKDIPAMLAEANLTLTLHGHVSGHDNLVEIFQQCKYMLTCSYEDNWPNILVEAGAYGCIPIVGKGHGCEEFCLELNTGIISKEYSNRAFADSLNSALNISTANRLAMAESLIERTRKMHSYAVVSEKYLSTLIGISNQHNTIITRPNITSDKSQKLQVSENYLGRLTKSLLLENKIKNHAHDSLEISIFDTPFKCLDSKGKANLVVNYDDQTSEKIHIEPRQNIQLAIVEKSRCMTSVFTLGSCSFGLMEFNIQLL